MKNPSHLHNLRKDLAKSNLRQNNSMVNLSMNKSLMNTKMNRHFANKGFQSDRQNSISTLIALNAKRNKPKSPNRFRDSK